VESQRHDISQYYIFMLGDDRPVATADNWFQVMGLYQNLTDIGPHANGGAYNQQYTNAGIGFKTTSDLLMNYRYNEVRTLAMNLPANIGGLLLQTASALWYMYYGQRPPPIFPKQPRRYTRFLWT